MRKYLTYTPTSFQQYVNYILHLQYISEASLCQEYFTFSKHLDTSHEKECALAHSRAEARLLQQPSTFAPSAHPRGAFLYDRTQFPIIWCWGQKLLTPLIPDCSALRAPAILKTFVIRSFFFEKRLLTHVFGGSQGQKFSCKQACVELLTFWPWYHHIKTGDTHARHECLPLKMLFHAARWLLTSFRPCLHLLVRLESLL